MGELRGLPGSDTGLASPGSCINTRSLVLKVQGEKAVFGGWHRPAPGGTAPLYESSHGQGVCVLLMPLSGVWNRVRGQI